MHSRLAFEQLTSSFRGTSQHEQWDALVAKVGGKVFAIRDLGEGASPTTLKVTELSFEVLTELPGIGQAAYFAKRKWVTIADGALTGEELASYIVQSHALVAAGLTRKLRAELGL